MTEDDDRPDGSETDWSAACPEAYGFGYTREQAVMAMLAHVDMRSTPLQVDLIEHIGELNHSMWGHEVETLVSQETVELPGDLLPKAISLARESHSISVELLDNAEEVDTDD